MRPLVIGTLSILILSAGTVIATQEKPDLYFKKWLEEDVGLIILPEEREVYLKLVTPQEKTAFIEQFWKRRDPTPETQRNEYKEEHYRRIAYANERFACGKPGWMTDRGRIYVKFGAPAGIEARPTGGTYTRPMSEGGGVTYAYPFEIWRYNHIDGVGDNVFIEFVDPSRTNDFHIARSPMEKDALLMVPNTGLTLAEEMGLETRADRITRDYLGDRSRDPLRYPSAEEMPFERLSIRAALEKAPPIRYENLRTEVTSAVHYNLLAYSVRTDQVEVGPEISLVPVTLEIPNSILQYQKTAAGQWYAEADLYGRVVSLQGSLISEFDDALRSTPPPGANPAEAQNLLYQKALFLKPGSYKLELILQETQSGKMGSRQQRILVPAPPADRSALRASPPILALTIERSENADPRFEQFQIGALKVVPNVRSEYRVGQNLWVYFHLFGFQNDQASGKPSLNITYEIARKNMVFGRFPDMTGRSIRETGTSRLICTGGVPLSAFAPGSYELRVTIEDRIAGQTLTLNTPFTLKSR